MDFAHRRIYTDCETVHLQEPSDTRPELSVSEFCSCDCAAQSVRSHPAHCVMRRFDPRSSLEERFESSYQPSSVYERKEIVSEKRSLEGGCQLRLFFSCASNRRHLPIVRSITLRCQSPRHRARIHS